MLIKYEYELLSAIVENGIKKVDGNIIVTTKRIDTELKDDKFYEYIQSLQIYNIVDYQNDKIKILVENWIDFFIRKLSEVFIKNNMNVTCTKRISYENFEREFYIDFMINGTNTSFELKFNNLDNTQENIIFMCIPNIYIYKEYIGLN